MSSCTSAAIGDSGGRTVPGRNQLNAEDQPLAPSAELALSAEREDERLTDGAQGPTYVPFVPRHIGVYLERFYSFVGTLALAKTLGEAVAAVRGELVWLAQQGGAPTARLKYQAALNVLDDLIDQGWRWRLHGQHLELAPPDFTAPPSDAATLLHQKEEIRRSMASERLAQLNTPSTRRFLAEMEQARSHRGRTLSVLDLVASGEDLARDLRAVERLPETDRDAALVSIIDPYLQLIEGEARCTECGYRLIDIWRYFRYTWSLPYFSTPGRNLFYLVRDRARPLHPIIGIAALGNSIVRLAAREERIGWTVDAVASRVAAVARSGDTTDAERLAGALTAAVETAISQIDLRGLASPEEIAAPTEDTVARLLAQARASAGRRIAHLRDHEDALRSDPSALRRARTLSPDDVRPAGERDDADLSAADRGVEALFDQKRATELADLLRTKAEFLAAGLTNSPVRGLQALLETEEGRRAIAAAIRAQKRQHIGTSMMDVIICGAIPPYTHLLGGKLVCMLLTSPQVRLEYRERYSDAASHIASRMAGGRVAKPADLVFLGTTSLYHVGSSQYNRVRIPATVAGGHGEVRYDRFGATRGYGSVHFSERTRGLLEEVTREEHGALLVTRTFGEGVNPKLRLLREGLSCVGLDEDRFLRHQCRRIIYGVSLAHNTAAYLRGEEVTPDYILPATTTDEGKVVTAAIAAHWAARWLRRRITNADVLSRVARTRAEGVRVSAAADRNGGGVAEERSDAPRDTGGGGGAPPPHGPIGVRFIQQLYNHRSCYADRLTQEQLDAVHIETPLERFVLERLREGRDIVLTGNPGDGKTHLLRRLQPALEALGAAYHLDATAEESYAAIIAAWTDARERAKPFCLAVNEWPLLELVREFAAAFPPLHSVRAQVEQAVVYAPQPPATYDAVVIDLNHRTLVDEPTVAAVLHRLTDDRFFPECRTCPGRETCSVPPARRALRTDRVQARMFRLLDLAVRRGAHVTMRDLQGFVAFVITSGRTCEELIRESEPSGYWDRAFAGASDLFDAIRSAFDPARVTHPDYDELLWEGRLPAAGWADPAATILPPPAQVSDADTRLPAMRSLKRRFFFEHADGERLFDLLPQDERACDAALAGAEAEREGTVRALVGLLNRFFDPRDRSDAQLRLWTTHHYDARWAPTYLSARTVAIEHLRLSVPRLAPHVSAAFRYHPDHALLTASHGDRVVGTLRVDLQLYRALYDAQRGLPLALRSPEVTKRIELFFNSLGPALRTTRDIEDLHVKNFKTGADMQFKVDRRNRRYGI